MLSKEVSQKNVNQEVQNAPRPQLHNFRTVRIDTGARAAGTLGVLDTHLDYYESGEHGYLVVLNDLASCLRVSPVFLVSLSSELGQQIDRDWVWRRDGALVRVSENGVERINDSMQTLLPHAVEALLKAMPDMLMVKSVMDQVRKLNAALLPFNEKGGSHE